MEWDDGPLAKRIDAFLRGVQTPCSDTGGHAEVTDDQLDDLREIVQLLIAARWERNSDGDRPVGFRIVDRTKYESSHFVDMPHSDDVDPEEYLDSAAFNVGIAQSNFQTAWWLFNHHQKRLKGT